MKNESEVNNTHMSANTVVLAYIENGSLFHAWCRDLMRISQLLKIMSEKTEEMRRAECEGAGEGRGEAPVAEATQRQIGLPGRSTVQAEPLKGEGS